MGRSEVISRDEILELKSIGHSQSAIADMFDVTRQAISAKLKYQPKQVAIRRKHFSVVFLRRLGFEIPQIIEMTNYSYPSVLSILKANNFIPSDKRFKYSNSSEISKKKRERLIKQFIVVFLFRIGFCINDIVCFTQYPISIIIKSLYDQNFSLKGRL